MSVNISNSPTTDVTSIGSYGKLQICPPDGTTCHGHAYISWTDIGHAHNEDNDDDKKNFNKLNTKFYTIVVTHLLFFYIFWGHVRLII